jgi:signal transduction histidine kinase/ligand-binding sensor domain-containing protein/DNA-binding response OmpR family regulator
VRFQYTIIFLFSLVAIDAYPQSGKLFSVDHELSSSLINHVYQDSKSVIWIATEDGLNRYDGSKFTIYKKIKHDSTSLLHNYVRLLFEDRKGNLFVGFFNGLQLYNYATDTFQEIPMILENGYTFPAHVTSILQRYNGDILVGTSGHGVFIVRMDNQVMRAYQFSKFVPSFLTKSMYEDSRQNLWISTQDKGLFCIGRNEKIRNYFSSEKSDNIFSLCEDRAGNLYAGSVTTGLQVYDERSRLFRAVTPGNAARLPITTLRLSRDGEILIGTEGAGMRIYDPQKREILKGNFNIDTFDFSKEKVHSILQDESGNLWLGIYQKGVVLLPAKNNNFEYYGHKSVRNDVIGSNTITALYKDHEGTLWVGTDGDGIYGLGPAGEQKVHFKPSPGATGIPATILNIYEDSDNNLWLGSYDRGLCKMDRRTSHCTYINRLLENDQNHVLRVFSVTEDHQKNLWISTMGMGLYAMNLVTLDVVHYTASTGDDYRPQVNRLHSDWINTALISNGEKLYIGTVDGLGCLDLKTRNFTTVFNGINRLLSGVIVHSLYEDNEGTLWIGTSDGLMSVDKGFKDPTKPPPSYTMDDGLPSNEVCAIREDTTGNLWISTNYGISRFNLKNKSFINYYSDDGLQGNEFSTASYADRNGQIMFGGMNGITLFTPDRIRHESKRLAVRVTGFYIHNQPVRKGMKSDNHDIISSSVMEADTFHLSHRDNSFTIEFSVMEFRNPERITYMYSLQEEEDWIILRPGTNNVTFNNLSPGEYKFKVRAKDYDTYSDAKTISVIVHPVWYFSPWAKVTYTFFFITIAYIILQQVRQRQRAQRKMMEHIQAKKINEAKLQFFINIAHEIRTPLSLIISPLKKLVSKDRDRDRQRSYFMMNRHSERILHLVNQLMDIQKIDQGQMVLVFQETELVGFIHDLYDAFEEQTQNKQIEVLYTHAMDTLNVWIDPNNFDKVILNVLSNALKFTPVNGKISIALTAGESTGTSPGELHRYVEIIISDTGTGIPKDELERVFECFYQVREIKHTFSSGTGIGLHLSRSVVELHHGKIWAENNSQGPGCRFIIRVPLGADHLKPAEMIPGDHTSHQRTQHFIPALPNHPVDLPETKIKSKSKRHILVVDDDPEIRRYVCNEMASDYHMAECINGKEALAFALKNNPDLIISDIMMPEMDGIMMCQKIKQNVNINHIPVVLLTAKAEEEDTLEGLGIGADAYIVKPFNIEVLKKTVQNIIRNREILKNNFTGSQQQKDKVVDVSVISSDEKLLTRIMDTINKNIANPALNVEMLSREIGISRVHLHRKLKELTSQSTRDLIRNIRLQQAAKLLSEKQLNISQVGFAVGFTNVAHFSNAFKEFYGVSPTHYMEDHHQGHKKSQHPQSS